MSNVIAMRFHFPGWELTLHEGEGAREAFYQVWAPGPIEHEGHATGRVRDHWQSSWQNHFGGFGSGTTGATMEDVLALFPPQVQAKFRQVIQAWQATQKEADR